MSNPLLTAVRKLLPASGLNIASRAALLLLADAANEKTGLAWYSQAYLSSLIGCAPTYVPRVLAPLEAAGIVQIYKRAGRASIYLTDIAEHNHGGQLAISDVRAHLRTGKFSAAEIDGVLIWLGQFRELVPVVAALPTSQHSREVGNAGREPLKSVDRHPSTQSSGTPQHSRDEPEKNPKITQSAGPRPAKMGGLAGAPAGQAPPAAEALIDAGQAIATIDGKPDMAIEASVPVDAEAICAELKSWTPYQARGLAPELLARLIAKGGKIGENLDTMKPDQALATVENALRLRLRRG